MECASQECGNSSRSNDRSAIERAHTLLESSLAGTDTDIQAIVALFEKLSAQVDGILNLTSSIVDCVRKDWVKSIVPMTRTLDAAARRFIAGRVESIAAIGAVFESETSMTENLLTLTAEQRSIAREGLTLGVLASIEVGRLGTEGNRFSYMARELGDFSAMASSGAAKVRMEAAQRRAGLIDRRHRLNLSLEKRREHFRNIESEMVEAITAMETALAHLVRIPADFQQYVARIASDISSVVQAVQLQDVTRQQIEHARDALIRISGRIEDRADARSSAILKIQTRQIESARNSTEGWISSINGCLASILRVSSSDVVAIGAQILAQERSFSAQLARIELLGRECEDDDAEIEACLAGLGDLLRITKEHLERSRSARDRMRLLNFNSMIEARRLGSHATAILEITRNISRVSSGWSALTDRAGNTLEAMLNSSAQAEEAHRTSTRISTEALFKEQSRSHAGLRALHDAASIADSNGRKIETAIIALHEQIRLLAEIARSLERSATLLSDARNEIEQASESAPSFLAGLSQHDREQIEIECAAAYTCELERRILRSALYGETPPVDEAASTSGEIEMF